MFSLLKQTPLLLSSSLNSINSSELIQTIPLPTIKITKPTNSTINNYSIINEIKKEEKKELTKEEEEIYFKLLEELSENKKIKVEVKTPETTKVKVRYLSTGNKKIKRSLKVFTPVTTNSNLSRGFEDFEEEEEVERVNLNQLSFTKQNEEVTRLLESRDLDETDLIKLYRLLNPQIISENKEKLNQLFSSNQNLLISSLNLKCFRLSQDFKFPELFVTKEEEGISLLLNEFSLINYNEEKIYKVGYFLLNFTVSCEFIKVYSKMVKDCLDLKFVSFILSELGLGLNEEFLFEIFSLFETEVNLNDLFSLIVSIGDYSLFLCSLLEKKVYPEFSKKLLDYCINTQQNYLYLCKIITSPNFNKSFFSPEYTEIVFKFLLYKFTVIDSVYDKIKLVKSLHLLQQFISKELSLILDGVMLKVLNSFNTSLLLVDAIIEMISSVSNVNDATTSDTTNLSIIKIYFLNICKYYELFINVKKRIIKYFFTLINSTNNDLSLELISLLLNTLQQISEYCNLIKSDYCDGLVNEIVKGLDGCLLSDCELLFKVVKNCKEDCFLVWFELSDKKKGLRDVLLKDSEYLEEKSLLVYYYNLYVKGSLINCYEDLISFLISNDNETVLINYLKSFTLFYKSSPSIISVEQINEISPYLSKIILKSTNTLLLDATIQLYTEINKEMVERVYKIGVKYIYNVDDLSLLDKSLFVVGRILFYQRTDGEEGNISGIVGLVDRVLSLSSEADSNLFVLKFLFWVYWKYSIHKSIGEEIKPKLEEYFLLQTNPQSLSHLYSLIKEMFQQEKDVSFYTFLFHQLFSRISLKSKQSTESSKEEYEFVYCLVKDGLIHPLESTSYFIIQEAFYQRGKLLHLSLVEKYSDFIHSFDFDGMVCVYDLYYKQIGNDGLRLNESSLFETLVELNCLGKVKSIRKEFVKSVFKEYDDLKLQIFILWNLLMVNFQAIRISQYSVYVILYHLDYLIYDCCLDLSSLENCSKICCFFKIRKYCVEKWSVVETKLLGFSCDKNVDDDVVCFQKDGFVDYKKDLIDELESYWKLYKDESGHGKLVQEAKELEEIVKFQKNEKKIKQRKSRGKKKESVVGGGSKGGKGRRSSIKRKNVSYKESDSEREERNKDG